MYEKNNKRLIYKRILSVLLTLAFCLTVLPLRAVAEEGGEYAPMPLALEATESFAGGSGTANAPYLIATAGQLKLLANMVSDGNTYSGTYFKLTADIDLGGSEEDQWMPIGTDSSHRFYGTFDGDGHKISGLYIKSDKTYQGLFGYTGSGSTIQNIGVSGYIEGANTIGGVVGCNFGTVQNCFNTATVSGTNMTVGGVVGVNHKTVQNCFNIADVNGSQYVGGVVGEQSDSSVVQKCYNIGKVNGKRYVGGVVGRSYHATVQDCYNTGSVTGSQSEVGGVVGTTFCTSSTLSNLIQNCYNIGSVGGTTQYIGGVVGYNSRSSSQTSTVKNCYFLRSANPTLSGVGGNSGSTNTVNVEYKSEEEIQALTGTLNTGDYADAWEYHEMLKRPVLVGVTTITLIDETVPLGGTGAITLPDVRDYINGSGNFDKNPHTGEGEYFMLTEKVELNGNASNQWAPIGNYDIDDDLQFSGTFDGGGYLINGLYINNNSANRLYYGLFGYVVGGTIKNLGVNGSVTGNQYIGGIVGSGKNCTIENCYNIGEIKGIEKIGGICGNIDFGSDAKFINCYNAGYVEAFDNYAGGITGFGYLSTIRNCYNIGNVTSGYYAGGIAGSGQGGHTIEYCYNGEGGIVKGGAAGGIVGDNGLIENCYNAGTVEGTDDSFSVGGISGSSATITNCYNIGKITGTSENVGGIVGFYGKAANCYNIGKITGTAKNVGGIAGVYSDVTNCHNFGTIDVTGDNVGGIAGDFNEEYNVIENCYYLKDDQGGHLGIGSTEEDTIGQAEAKDTAQFASGEVAWLLQDGQDEQVWYQNTNTEDYPTFVGTADTIVYRVAFISGIEENKYPYEAHYDNAPFTVSAAPTDAPEREGYKFVRWSNSKTDTEDEFTSVTVNDEDVDIYAVWRETFGANDDAEPLTIKISRGETSDEYDLDDLLAYYSGETVAAEKFTYVSEYDEKDGLTVTVRGSMLTVAASSDAAECSRELKITAREKVPQLSTIALLADYGTDDVDLTVTVIVTALREREAPDADSIEVKKSHNSITVTSPDNSDEEFEFSIDGGETWQRGNEFTGLDAGKTYEISVRYKETDEYGASDSATKDVTTAENANGKTTLKPGETVEGTGKGEDVSNKNGKVTIEDGNGNGNKTDVTLPDGITEVEIDEDGNVIIPGGSKVAPENGANFTVVDEATVGADGSVTFPDGGDIEFGNTEINVPDNKPVTPNNDDTLTIPDGSEVTPPSDKPVIEIDGANDEATVDRNGNVKFPSGGTAKVGDTEVTIPPNGTVNPVGDSYLEIPAGSVIEGDTLENGGILDENGKLLGDTVKIGNVLFIPPEGKRDEIIDNDGIVTVPAGTTVIPDGRTDYIIGEGGGTVDSDNGNVELPDGGSITLGQAEITMPDSGIITPNSDGNTVTVPDGAEVTPPKGDPKITIKNANNEATVDKSGNVTFPERGDIEIGGTTVTVPKDGKAEPNGDGTITVPKGSVAAGDPEITLPDGAVIDRDGNIILPEGGDIKIGETTVNVPAGGTVTPNGDGTVTVPDGSAVTPPSGKPTITIVDANDEATVDKDGNITFPNGGDAQIGGADITVPSGGTIEPREDGKVFLPEDTSVTQGGTITAPEGGAVYDPETGEFVGDDGSGDDPTEKPGSVPVFPSDSTSDPSGDTDDPTDKSDPSTGDNTEPSDRNIADNVNVGVVVGENAPKVTVSEETLKRLKEEVIADHLTPEEIEAAENGAVIDMILSVELVKGNLSDEDKQAIEAVLTNSEYAIGMHMNIELIKLINGQPVGKITEINAPIRVTIEVPEDLRSTNRVFYAVRVHNGEAAILEDTDSAPDTLTIVTDKFSIYSIVYRDSELPDAGNPNTGITEPITTAVLACAVFAATITFKKKKML